MPLTSFIQMQTPSPCSVYRFQHRLVRAGVCICRIIFLTGASNHNDSFPFSLSFSSFCTLHRFRRAQSTLSCYLPLFVPFPLPSFFSTLSILSALGALGGGGACCCREGVEEGAGEGEWEWEWVRRTLPPPSP